MEKKTKKLQLRKETIAVLNDERMSHVVGGNGVQKCQNGGIFDGEICFCPPDFYGQYCEIPQGGGTIIIESLLTACEASTPGATCPSKTIIA